MYIKVYSMPTFYTGFILCEINLMEYIYIVNGQCGYIVRFMQIPF